MAQLDTDIQQMADTVQSTDAVTRLGKLELIPAAVISVAVRARELLARGEASFRVRRLACERLGRFIAQLDGRLIDAVQKGVAQDSKASHTLRVMTKIPPVRWSEQAVRNLLEEYNIETPYEDVLRRAVADGWLCHPKPYLEWEPNG